MIRLTTACDDNGEMRLLLNTTFDKNSIKKHTYAEGVTIQWNHKEEEKAQPEVTRSGKF